MQEVKINTWSVVKAALVLILIYVLFLLRDLVLVLLTAVVIASAIEPAARWFQKYKIPRLPAVLIVYFLVALGITAIVYFLVPPLLEEASDFMATVPQYISSINIFGDGGLSEFDPTQAENTLTQVASQIPMSELINNLSGFITRIPGNTFNTVSAVFGGAISFTLIIVLSFYLAVQERGIENFLRVVVPVKNEEYIVDLWRRAQQKIGRWMQGQVLLGLLVGILVYLGLAILGVEHAFLLAILAGVLELIPLFGPIISSVPAILLGFIDGGITFALVIAGVYIIIQQFENHLIYPLVVHKVVGVPALLVILALIIGAQLAGFLGMILAVPLATALLEFTDDVQKKHKRAAMSSAKR